MSKKDESRSALGVETLLRSINVVFDVAEPGRIAHFRPTSKSISLLTPLVVGDRGCANVLVAPYGSAKSLTATFAAQVVENLPRSRDSIRSICSRMAKTAPTLAKKIVARTGSVERGLAVVINGAVASVPEALRQATVDSLIRSGRGRLADKFAKRVESVSEYLHILAELGRGKNCPDRILFVWDEFGRHLEHLIATGRSSELNELQNLAEFATRQERIPTSVALLMHQPIVQYAGSAPQMVRQEWSKISGRFETIEFLDDSNELLRLVADVVRSKAQDSRNHLRKSRESISQSAKRLGLFPNLGVGEIQALELNANPMNLVALSLLPRISGRIAQNERTLFTFLGMADTSKPIGLPEVYDYFSGVMRGDNGAGGSYRQYLEAESALSRSTDIPLAPQVIKTVALLGLGAAGGRSVATRPLVELALTPYGATNEVRSTIDTLIRRKALIYRRHANELSVWHGADVDLRGRIETEISRETADSDSVCKALSGVAVPYWKPIAYNVEHCLTRSYATHFCKVADLESVVSGIDSRVGTSHSSDGDVVYLVIEDEHEIVAARQHATAFTKSRPTLLVVVPKKPLGLRDSVSELQAIARLQRDSDLISSDPLVGAEVQQLLDDARSHFSRLVDALTLPGGGSATWFCGGAAAEVRNHATLQALLSRQMSKLFSGTPKIANELVNRRRPSAVVVNARKKLNLAILERTGRVDLGIEGRSADYSIYRSVLRTTGLYLPSAEVGVASRFAQPDELADPGLRSVWSKFRDFVSVADGKQRDIEGFFSELRRPPVGLRDGLIPVFFAAALRAFPAPIVLTKDGEYVADLLPSVVEDICKRPADYAFTVLHLDEAKERFLANLLTVFASGDSKPDDVADYVRLCFDAVESWKRQLPQAAMKTQRIAQTTRSFRDAVQKGSDALRMLLVDVPESVGAKDDLEVAIARIVAAKRELEDVPRRHESAAYDSIRRTLGVGQGWDSGLRGVCDVWVGAIPDTIRAKLKANRDDPRPYALIERMLIRYDSDEQLLNSICSLMVDGRVSRWEDSTPAQFARAFDDTVQRIEQAVVDAATGMELGDNERVQVAALAESRMRAAIDGLAKIVGREEAGRAAKRLLKELDSKGAG